MSPTTLILPRMEVSLTVITLNVTGIERILPSVMRDLLGSEPSLALIEHRLPRTEQFLPRIEHSLAEIEHSVPSSTVA